MNRKNKQVSIYFVLMFVSFILAIICLIVSFILPNLFILFVCLSIVLLLAVVGLFIADRSIIKERNRIIEVDKANIIKSLEEYQHNKRVMVNPNSNDKGLVEIASVVNDIVINDTILEYSQIYNGEEFFTLIRKYITKSGINKFALIRITGINKKKIDKIISRYPRCFVGEYNSYFDLVIETFDKKELEEYLSTFVEQYKDCYIKVFYYDEYSLDEIAELMKVDEENKLAIYDRNSEKEVFNNVINKYKDIDLSKDNLIENYLIDIFPHLPFTHMAVLIDEEYLRLVNYKGSLLISDIQDKEFKTWLKLSGVKYLGKQAYVIFANENNEVPVTPTLLYKLNKVVSFINNLVVVEMDNRAVNEAENRFNKLEEMNNSLSYEVDDEYIIRHASKKLNERYNNKLVGSYCYEALYDKESPCKNCPLKEKGSKTYMLTSNLYQRTVSFGEEKKTIYLLHEKTPFVNSRESLNNYLLGLLNNPNAKGYLIAFKIDALTQLANKNKLNNEQVIDEIIKCLDMYGLTDNLYRKEVDEFVYVLKYASISDAIRIAKGISQAFLETFKIGNVELNFLPKVILLSYPLEVNTIFSLDSLCRTLFARASKKGMLYRVDEEAKPIDDHRHYMDIVEEAFKNNEIPVSYFRIKDLDNKQKMSFVGYRFLDENHNHIADDLISLYVKIDGKYVTFMDKFVRSFNFDNDVIYVTSIGKEGLEKQLFDILIGFFETKHIPLNRVVFEAKEKDIFKHLEAVNYALDLGFNIALHINDSGSYNLDQSRFTYIRIDGSRLDSDRGYQNKINEVIKGDKPILIEEKYKDLINGARFVF